jgi:hypothetical protein
VRIIAAVALALGIASCYGHERPVGDMPTPLSVKTSAAQSQAQSTADREQMSAQGADATELAKNGASCSADSDCTGRLRCVSHTGAAGREMRQCLFPCGEGCPSGWNCQITSDGPSNTCARAR